MQVHVKPKEQLLYLYENLLISGQYFVRTEYTGVNLYKVVSFCQILLSYLSKAKPETAYLEINL